MKKILLLLLVYSLITQGQVKGVVTDSEGIVLQDVFVSVKNSTKWTLSNNKGKFKISLPDFPYTLQFSFLGKKKQEIIITKPIQNLQIILLDDNLKVEEVVVTAKKKTESTGSKIILSKQAINLVQAQSLANVMQLIPGTTFNELSLENRQLLNIRSAYFSEGTKYNTNGDWLSNSNDEFYLNNTFGVGYVIDDIPLNNDVNMTGGKGIKYGLFQNIENNSSVNRGVDLKNITTNNVESIEVVQGISSAKYGNHTSGLVKINRAYGEAPFRLNTTLRKGSYGVALSKGVRLSNKKGFLNFSLDYLHSNEDPRNSISKYDRLIFNTSWRYRKAGKIQNTLGINLGSNFNGYNIQETKFKSVKKENKSKNIRITNSNIMYFDNVFLDNLSTRFMVSYANNYMYNAYFKSTGGNPLLNSYKEGTYEATYSPVAYWDSNIVENKPFSFFGNIDGVKSFRKNSSSLKLNTGVSLNINKNFGKGDLKSIENTSISSSISTKGLTGFRNINFNKQIPTKIHFSAYTTAHIRTQIFDKKWLTDIGVRYDNYNKQSTISPRLNTVLYLSKNIQTRFGFGMFSKAPSLQSTYPGNLYYDFLIADYRTGDYSFALGHTIIRNYRTKNLKPSRTLKYETGIDFHLKPIIVSLTGYYNRQYDGFTKSSNFEIIDLPTYNFTFYPKRAPDYELSGTKKVLLNYTTPVNKLETKNYGLELMLNTKKIRSIHTSFNISGAYRYTQNSINIPKIVKNKIDATSDVIIGFHDRTSYRYEKINTAITAIHHISSIGLIITLRAEQFIMAKKTYDSYDIYPYAYLDANLNYIEIPKQERADLKYASVRKTGVYKEGDSSDIEKMYGNYHLQLSKQFDNGFQFSFYAINFLNHLPKIRKINSDGEFDYSSMNEPISFGGSIRYKF